MIRGIHHTSISTGDLDRLLGFYRDLLGLEVLLDSQFGGTAMEHVTALPGAKGRVVFLRAVNAHIELFEYAEPAGAAPPVERPVNDHGLTHLCFDVVDLPAEYDRLTAAGVRFHCEPQWMAGGAVRTTYARDPDGNVVELQEVVDPSIVVAMDF